MAGVEETMKGHLIKPNFFVLDVDGVFNDGKFYYTTEGKVMKQYGPEDNDALSLLKDKLVIQAISGDKRGFSITKKRIADDMKLPLELVSTFKRVEWMRERFNLEETIFMGDGIYDALVFQQVGYSIAPANAFYTTKRMANFVTNARGGEGAVAEACLHILEKFFEPFDINKLTFEDGSGSWSGKADTK
jgi:3-deoxy-D-manno-octulosonate 8-phosphate phosphatase (KDO 8-P phosphatase)